MRVRPYVLKIGGRLCEDATVRAQFAQACAAEDRPLVIVHGGGCLITELQQSLGIVPQFHEGRRITLETDMPHVEMALSGSVNKSLVRALNLAGRKSVGLSGCDAGMVRCELVPHLGRVGLPVHVDTSVLTVLLEAGFLPVISPVSLGPEGEPVNVNADELASAVAIALQAEALWLVSDVTGVRVEGAERREIIDSEIEALVAAGEITGGMVPKLRSAALATRSGVDEVRITGFQGSLRSEGGTCVRASRLECC